MGPTGRSIWRFWLALALLSAVLAVVLLATGHILFGVILVVITATRAAMVLRWWQRRRGAPGRLGRDGGPGAAGGAG